MATLIELQRDVVQPRALNDYVKAVSIRSKYRDSLDPGHLGSFRVSVGRTSSLYHLSAFADYDARDARDPDARTAAAAGLDATESSIFTEATATLNEAGIAGLAGGGSLDATAGSVFEMRSYELVLGYTTVPRFMELYAPGVKDKIRVDDTGESRLVSLLYSEGGVAPLNTVIELWRHNSAQGSQRSREKSREANEWKKSIGAIAQLANRFESQILVPLL